MRCEMKSGVGKIAFARPQGNQAGPAAAVIGHGDDAAFGPACRAACRNDESWVMPYPEEGPPGDSDGTRP